MNYEEKENKIIDYVRDNFNSFTNDDNIDHYINEYLDFDLYTMNKIIFFQFENYEYQELTNSSNLETANMSVFIVIRNDTEKNLHKKLRIFASAFYNMFEKSGCNFNGIVDQGMITNVFFYDAVEANKNIKLCKFDLTLYKETI
jgi:hypothetical protein